VGVHNPSGGIDAHGPIGRLKINPKPEKHVIK
jgi:hypothetical protein